jgi:tRNA A-37 threonylcarbamoyl transferase component Bud32
MRFGRPLEGPISKDVIRGATRSLRALHGAGLCHTDCRKPNILSFEDGPQLVDFGLVCALDTEQEYEVSSHSRAALFPQELQELLAKHKKVNYAWSKRDDMEMLALAQTADLNPDEDSELGPESD